MSGRRRAPRPGRAVPSHRAGRRRGWRPWSRQFGARCRCTPICSDERDLGGVLNRRRGPAGGIDPSGDLATAERLGIRFVMPGDDEWPGQAWTTVLAAPPVQERGGPPLGLWVKGPLRLDQLAGAVAVVGSRSATTYGADVAAEPGGRTSPGPVTAVVSGAAFGIDQAAHRGASRSAGPTVAVLACGVDRAYPARPQERCWTTSPAPEPWSRSSPPGCAPTRLRFLARNRLIAALTRGTVVVEAALRSGALNTANWAARLNRPLMGVPGPVTSAPSQGVHQLRPHRRGHAGHRHRRGARGRGRRRRVPARGRSAEPTVPGTGSPSGSARCSTPCPSNARPRPPPSPAPRPSALLDVQSALTQAPGQGARGPRRSGLAARRGCPLRRPANEPAAFLDCAHGRRDGRERADALPEALRPGARVTTSATSPPSATSPRTPCGPTPPTSPACSSTSPGSGTPISARST